MAAGTFYTTRSQLSSTSSSIGSHVLTLRTYTHLSLVSTQWHRRVRWLRRALIGALTPANQCISLWIFFRVNTLWADHAFQWKIGIQPCGRRLRCCCGEHSSSMWRRWFVRFILPINFSSPSCVRQPHCVSVPVKFECEMNWTSPTIFILLPHSDNLRILVQVIHFNGKLEYSLMV